jgi:hypothetical protein
MPHLEFASQAWSPWLTGDKEVLEKVQRKAVGMVSGLEGKSYEERCKELGLETVLRIRDVYPGSRIRFFPSRIPDPNCLHPGSRILIKEFKYFNLKKPKNGV